MNRWHLIQPHVLIYVVEVVLGKVGNNALAR